MTTNCRNQLPGVLFKSQVKFPRIYHAHCERPKDIYIDVKT